MNANQALYNILESIEQWLEEELKAKVEEALHHRREELQSAKDHCERGDMEAAKHNMLAACQWHQTYKEALTEKRIAEEAYGPRPRGIV